MMPFSKRARRTKRIAAAAGLKWRWWHPEHRVWLETLCTLVETGRQHGGFNPFQRGECLEQTKTTEVVHTLGGEVVVAETWSLRYEDGHTDTLRREHPVTAPAELAIFREDTECV